MAVGIPTIPSIFYTEGEMGVGDKSENNLSSQHFMELSIMSSVYSSLTPVVVRETRRRIILADTL